MKFKMVEGQKELKDAFSVRKTVFICEQNVPEEIEIDEYEDASTHFILYQENLPIGAGRFRFIEDYGKVERICVLPEARKIGAGKAIMEGIEQFAAQNGLHKLKLHAQTHAIPFYSRLGYEVISDEFMDAGIPHKTMMKEI